MSFLELRDITKTYGTLNAVSDVTLSVEKGEFVSLLGPSGCGKTTTLQMIAGFVDVTSGSIHLDGRDITRAKANTRGLGIVFQTYALFPHMTVFDNVSFGLEMQRVPKSERRARVEEALELVHLAPYAGRYPRELSGGQRQRVALARAIVIRPPVLLLDEPLSNLDAKLREAMQFELRDIQRKVGTTTVMVTHDQAEAFSISDRVVVMEAGRITQIDQPYRIYEHPQTEFISRFVGKTNLLPGTVKAVSGAYASVSLAGVPVEIDSQSGADMGGKGGALASGETVTLCIRPEKLRLTGAGQGRLPGRVSERYFLGSQWLYHVDGPLGTLMAVTPNDGSAPLDLDAPVGVDWSPSVVRVHRGAMAEAPDPALEAH
ncbi:putative spermidine/putrescine transport system ATP-binding protein [Azospirillum agricola]|uniref:ABC transporter ATP-binding protein n=1 Tax=Azospirillum agricola TaxID=1720247 RepID=UPI001AE4CCEB|nr:ATP-binding cassette domain-containing protein [Azospirillum agricola]MBP2230115.1 putative spermidine/putrescine transport system ATP-binding protein [Azospirillum agricola]